MHGTQRGMQTGTQQRAQHCGQQRRIRNGVRLTLCLIALVTTGMAAALPSPRAHAQQSDAADNRLGTRFILSDHRGSAVTDQDFAGSFLLMYFGYTHCPDVCPTGLLTLSAAIDQIGAHAERVRPVFVTVDPERDTVAALRDYVSSFHARLIGLTGSKEMIERVARGYRIKFERIEGKNKDAYTVDHTASLLFVGPSGEQIARFQHGTDASEIAAKVREAIAAAGPAPRLIRR